MQSVCSLEETKDTFATQPRNKHKSHSRLRPGSHAAAKQNKASQLTATTSNTPRVAPKQGWQDRINLKLATAQPIMNPQTISSATIEREDKKREETPDGLFTSQLLLVSSLWSPSLLLAKAIDGHCPSWLRMFVCFRNSNTSGLVLFFLFFCFFCKNYVVMRATSKRRRRSGIAAMALGSKQADLLGQEGWHT